MEDLKLDALRESFEDFVSSFKDHRLNRKKLHSLEEILFLTLCATICGADGWRDIERYGKLKIEMLQTIFPFKNGIPSDDTLRRFFRCLNPKMLQEIFLNWVKKLNLPNTKQIAIDGKISCNSYDDDLNPLHTVSAYATELRMVLCQEKVSEKSNEITAIPKLLEVMDVADSIITIDAMGCQKNISKLIRDKKADYILALKGNQGRLAKDVKLLFQDEETLNDYNLNQYHTVDGEHGRIENRLYRVARMPKILVEQHSEWTDLHTIIEVKSTREIKGKKSSEARYYISSLNQDAEKIGKAIRSHWGIENSLHWILDVTFADDLSRIRKGFAPQNMAMIKHFTLNLLQKSKGPRDSIKQMRKASGWDNGFLFFILGKI